LKNTRVADKDDLACITRIGESEYKLRIVKSANPHYQQLSPYAVNFIGHQGKRYGYIDNTDFERILGIRLSAGTYT
jgi:hypothetical protein